MPSRGHGILVLGLIMGLGGATAAWAHEPYMDCFDNKDNTITCEAGYEDGSAAGDDDKIFVKDTQGETLIIGNFTDGLYTFERPVGRFVVVFVGGDIGHVRRILDTELIER